MTTKKPTKSIQEIAKGLEGAKRSVTPSDLAITSAGFRRPAQTEPTDAQVIAALNAWHQDVMPVNRLGVFGTQKEDLMRAALKAAFTAGQEKQS